jgi:hypothetical protein
MCILGLTSDILSRQKHEQIMYHFPLLYRNVGAQSPPELSTVCISTPWERRLIAWPMSFCSATDYESCMEAAYFPVDKISAVVYG